MGELINMTMLKKIPAQLRQNKPKPCSKKSQKANHRLEKSTRQLISQTKKEPNRTMGK